MGDWVREQSPADKKYGYGWCRELDRCYRQDKDYLVMTRKIMTSWGTVEHVCIRNADSSDIPWSEKQRIKNELFGDKAIAIEVYPSKERLVDEAGMYHLWVLPEGFRLPFGIHINDEKTEHIPRSLMPRIEGWL